MSDPPTLYRVFSPARGPGGKTIAVFASAGTLETAEMQALAAQAGSPVSVFVQDVSAEDVVLRVFTPLREKGDSDSGALVALGALFGKGQIPDIVSVHMNAETTPAQLCGGEWLLRQGDVTVREEEASTVADRLGLDAATLGPVHVAGIARPNLVVELGSLEALRASAPDPEAVSELGRATATSGLLLYVSGGVPELGHADVSFRAFGPLRGFDEDAASSNMFACLVGVLGARGLLPATENLLRGLQLKPGQPARLTAQFVARSGGASDVWVGGRALPVSGSE